MVMSGVGAFYYLRIIRIMYFEDANEPLDDDIPVANRIVLGVLSRSFCFSCGS